MRMFPMFRRSVGALLTHLSAVLLVSSGCGKSDNIKTGKAGQISLRGNPVSFSKVPLGEKAIDSFDIVNTGEDTLHVSEIEFVAAENKTIKDLKILEKPEGGFNVKSREVRSIRIEYAPKVAGRPNGGIIKIHNTDPRHRDGNPAEVEVTTLGNEPELTVTPPTVRFPRLPVGQRETTEVTVQNTGDAPLEIFEKPIAAKSDDYRLEGVDQDYPLTLQPKESGEESGDKRLKFTVEYAPTADGSDTGELVLKSNVDGGTKKDPSIKTVDITADADTPCILVDGTTRNLGAVPLGGSTTEAIGIKSCGSKPLEISSIAIPDNTENDEFELDLLEHDSDNDGQIDDEIRLEEQGDRLNIPVTYKPTEAGSDRVMLEIQNNDPAQPTATVELIGRGADGQCPKAKLGGKVKGSASGRLRSVLSAPPLDYIVLDGSESEDPDGRIVDYEWRVIEKPDGSTVRIEPSESAPGDDAQREFRLLTAGTYKVGLKVKDNDGFESCNEAVVEVRADPNEKVHVELTWTNPEDPDETDDTGSDVDLHMAKMGPGQWFDAPYDIYFRNPNNGGGTGGSGIWSPENPSLDIDDTNGAGPENIQMDDPQDCQWYAVGVHYYEQTFGTAYATVRIYINGNLVFEKLNERLQRQGEFLDVARIHWPTGQVFQVDQKQPAPPIDKKPEVTANMKSSGLCTKNDLYETSK